MDHIMGCVLLEIVSQIYALLDKHFILNIIYKETHHKTTEYIQIARWNVAIITIFQQQSLFVNNVIFILGFLSIYL